MCVWCGTLVARSIEGNFTLVWQRPIYFLRARVSAFARQTPLMHHAPVPRKMLERTATTSAQLNCKTGSSRLDCPGSESD